MLRSSCRICERIGRSSADRRLFRASNSTIGLIPSQTRFLSNGTSNNPSKKRRRRRKPLVIGSDKSKELTTTREKMRTLVETNQLQQNVLPTRNQADDLVDLARSRVSWVQSKMYEFWNPDHVPASATAESSSSAGTAAVAAAAQRPAKNDVIMDARWWVWNVSYALFPAFVIALYCEFRGQYLMHDYYEGLEQNQMQRIMGDDFVAQHADELAVPPPQNFVVRLGRVIQEVTDLVMGVGGGGEQVAEGVAPVSRQSLGVGPTPVPTAPVATPVEPKSASAVNMTVAAGESNSTSITSNTSTDIAKDDLVGRIEHLEGLLLKQTRERKQQVDYQLERLQQSGTRNRMEDDLMEKWKHKMAEAPPVSTPERPMERQPPKVSSQESARSAETGEEAATAWSVWKVNEVLKEAVVSTLHQTRSLLGDKSTSVDSVDDTEEASAVPATTQALDSSPESPLEVTTGEQEHVSGLELETVDKVYSGDKKKKKPWWRPW